ncbi:MAG TPA: hypothetical protein VN838_17630 [Bradyrhizobium sp.]|nr:hypothetical protein [Bradyrhizobium sp.]
MISRRILAAAALLYPLSAPAQAQTGSFSAVTINPTVGTTNQGLVINQTLPSSGTATGPVLLNSITATNPGTLSMSNPGWDAFGQINTQVNALRVNFATTGGSGTNNGAFSVANFVTAPAEAYGAALGGTINGNAGPSVGMPGGNDFWGIIGYATVWPGASIGPLIGIEAEVGISNGGSATYRLGVGSNTQGPVQGSVLDAAFYASSGGVTVPGSDPGALAVPWQHLMALISNIFGPAGSPIAPTGDFFFSESPVTVAHFANLPNVTVTGNILDFPNMTIGGNGTASFGTGASGLPATGVLVSCASCGTSQVFGTPNGATGADGITIRDSSTNNIMFTGVAEASNTFTRFGQVTGNWGELVTLGSTNAGLMIGTLTNQPVIIGTNNTARMTLSGAGALTIPGTINGVTLDNTAWTNYTPTISAQTGSPAVAGLAGGRYKQIGKTVFVQITVLNSSNVSGASGGLKATLPITAVASGYNGSAYESALTGKSGGAFITYGAPALVQTSQADGSTWWVNNYIISISVTYEVP